MIGYLTGRVLAQKDSVLILETGGVGYEVQVSRSGQEALSQEGKGSLWIHTHFRQDAMELYGFLTQEEKKLFLSLIKVNGIGPKMALNVLNSCSLDQFILWIQEENIKAFMALPRVGRKMAQQIILTLKESLSKDFVIGKDIPYSAKVLSALEALGFSPEEIRRVLHKMDWKDDLQKDIKQALVHLNQL